MATVAVSSRKITANPLPQRKEQPKKLSKLGEWMRNNKGGIITVLDRRAVNK